MEVLIYVNTAKSGLRKRGKPFLNAILGVFGSLLSENSLRKFSGCLRHWLKNTFELKRVWVTEESDIKTFRHFPTINKTKQELKSVLLHFLRFVHC